MRAPDISTLQELYWSKKRRKRSPDWDYTEYEEDDDLFGSFNNSDWSKFEDRDFNISSLDGNYEDIGEYYNVNAYPKKYCKVRAKLVVELPKRLFAGV